MAKFDFSDALKKAGGAAKRATEKAGAAAQIGAEKAAIEATGVTAIAPQSAVKIFYYLMAIDRKITQEEEEKFDLIGKEIDPDFEAHKEALVKECACQSEISTEKSQRTGGVPYVYRDQSNR